MRVPRSLKELAQMHVSRLLRDALGALARHMGDDPLPAPRRAA